MSLLKRNSPRRAREKKDSQRDSGVGVLTPTLGPVAEKKLPTLPSVDIDDYKYKPEAVPEPVQLNQAIQDVPDVPVNSRVSEGFNLYDLSFFCEERLQQTLFSPGGLLEWKVRELTINFIRDRLNLYAEYSQEVTIGAFKDTLYYKEGQVLIPEEYLLITGFMRKYLGVETVNVLYETGEILIRECNYCNFWMQDDRIQRYINPINIPLDRSRMLDKDICWDCNLTCIFRQKKQINN